MNPVNCDDWTLGLNNTVLVNNISKYGCQIRIPKSCTFKVLSGTQDFSKITNLDCAEGKIDARIPLILIKTLKDSVILKLITKKLEALMEEIKKCY